MMLTRSGEDQDLKVVWFGIVWENTFSQERELIGIAKALGSDSHSTFFEFKRRWEGLDWRCRYGWLVLFEGFRSNGTPIRDAIKGISEFVSTNFD